MKEVVNILTAEADVTNWLDAKKIKPAEREKNKDFINTLIDAVMYGQLSIDADTRVITQKLDFPLDDGKGNITLGTLTYQPRAAMGNLLSKTGNLKGISMAVYIAYASTLTGEIIATLNRIDSEDFKVLQAITAFFL